MINFDTSLKLYKKNHFDWLILFIQIKYYRFFNFKIQLKIEMSSTDTDTKQVAH